MDIDKIRKAAHLVSNILLELKELTKPGVSLEALDEVANRRIKEAGAEPSLLNYQPEWAKTPYPATICASVDYEICHAPPGKRVLQEGSIVKYDMALKLNGAHADAAISVAVGEVDKFKQRLMRFGLEALYEGIKVVKAGQPISAIGRAIEDYCLLKNIDIIKDFSGHYIGKEIHEEPNIPSFYDEKYDNIFLEEGKVICIEPFVVRSGYAKVGIAEDGWTAFQLRGQPVVQFEHQILITQNGFEDLTPNIK